MLYNSQSSKRRGHVNNWTMEGLPGAVGNVMADNESEIAVVKKKLGSKEYALDRKVGRTIVDAQLEKKRVGANINCSQESKQKNSNFVESIQFNVIAKTESAAATEQSSQPATLPLTTKPKQLAPTVKVRQNLPQNNAKNIQNTTFSAIGFWTFLCSCGSQTRVVPLGIPPQKVAGRMATQSKEKKANDIIIDRVPERTSTGDVHLQRNKQRSRPQITKQQNEDCFTSDSRKRLCSKESGKLEILDMDNDLSESLKAEPGSILQLDELSESTNDRVTKVKPVENVKKIVNNDQTFAEGTTKGSSRQPKPVCDSALLKFENQRQKAAKEPSDEGKTENSIIPLVMERPNDVTNFLAKRDLTEQKTKTLHVQKSGKKGKPRVIKVMAVGETDTPPETGLKAKFVGCLAKVFGCVGKEIDPSEKDEEEEEEEDVNEEEQLEITEGDNNVEETLVENASELTLCSTPLSSISVKAVASVESMRSSVNSYTPRNVESEDDNEIEDLFNTAVLCNNKKSLEQDSKAQLQAELPPLPPIKNASNTDEATFPTSIAPVPPLRYKANPLLPPRRLEALPDRGPLKGLTDEREEINRNSEYLFGKSTPCSQLTIESVVNEMEEKVTDECDKYSTQENQDITEDSLYNIASPLHDAELSPRDSKIHPHIETYEDSESSQEYGFDIPCSVMASRGSSVTYSQKESFQEKTRSQDEDSDNNSDTYSFFFS